MGGPTTASDGSIWWNINYDTNADGWSIENFLQKAGSPIPTPSPGGCTGGCNNYYVSPSGSDSNPGTQASPWKTIQHADSALTLGPSGTCTAATGWLSVPNTGACVHVKAGTYNNANGIIITRDGGATTRIVYISDDGKWAAKIIAGPGGVNTTTFDIHGDYTDVDGFDVTLQGGNGNGIAINLRDPALHDIHIMYNYSHDYDNQANNCSLGSAGIAVSGGNATHTIGDP